MAITTLATALLSMLAVACTSLDAGSSPQSVAIMASRHASLAAPFSLDGATVGERVYVFVTEAHEGPLRVDFFLDGALLVGEGLNELADLEEGEHELVARQTERSGDHLESRALFQVRKPGMGAPREPEQAPPAPPVERSEVWSPKPGTSWQWQLTGAIDLSVDAAVFDVDLFDAPQATIDELHGRGRRVICYFSAGSYEAWRPDASRIPSSVRGAKMSGWDELWLDIRDLDALAPAMLGRLDLAAQKGCDAVEPDNVDGYANSTGFPLTYADQIRYNLFLADAAHSRGLAIGLKNDLDQVQDLEPYFDFAVNEECFSWGECEMLTPFVAANKAVFGVEYKHATSEFCQTTNALDFDFLRKRLELGAWQESCR